MLKMLNESNTPNSRWHPSTPSNETAKIIHCIKTKLLNQISRIAYSCPNKQLITANTCLHSYKNLHIYGLGSTPMLMK